MGGKLSLYDSSVDFGSCRIELGGEQILFVDDLLQSARVIWNFSMPIAHKSVTPSHVALRFENLSSISRGEHHVQHEFAFCSQSPKTRLMTFRIGEN
jgi:hypothetical protein